MTSKDCRSFEATPEIMPLNNEIVAVVRRGLEAVPLLVQLGVLSQVVGQIAAQIDPATSSPADIEQMILRNIQIGNEAAYHALLKMAGGLH